ncbi:MAG TPA: glucuronate isomerase [Clostridiaceae bacterium]|nr:glucuronate isomerase [Clostridiaceae bacterium]
MSNKPFIHDDFILQSDTAKRFYHDYAEKLPIIDFHCHLNPKEILDDKKFRNLGDIWLSGDHYKWRALRANAVPEELVSGDGDDRAKFDAWAKVMPYTIGNPLYHWSHLELTRYFGITDLLSPETADSIWEKANEQLKTDAFSTRNMIRRFKVELIGTTDDALSPLEEHKALKAEPDLGFIVSPTFRPDRFLHPQKEPFAEAVRELCDMLGIKPKELSFEDLMNALRDRIDEFVESGCRITDHGLENYHYALAEDSDELDDMLSDFLDGHLADEEDLAIWQTEFLLALSPKYVEHNLTMQVHFGAMRNNNTRMFRRTGPDAGFDSIGNSADIESLSCLLDAMNSEEALPRTILYNLNSSDNAALCTLCGDFNDAAMKAKVSFGAAWWFHDQKIGMERHLEDLSVLGFMRQFAGMVTDSRSFLSYTRHEYYRRILCNMLGKWWDEGLLPHDEALLKDTIYDMCYGNAKAIMGLD